jgi:hypothetical protein
MVTDPRFEDDRFSPEAPERTRSSRSSCLRGCLFALVALLILAVIAGVFIWRNWRDWAATIGEQAIGEIVAQAQFPAAEQQEIKQQVERVSEAFRAGKLSAEQLARLVEKIGRSPLMTSIVASAVNVNYIAKSGLNDEEKVAARQTVRRFLRGVVDQKIDEPAVDAAMAHVAVREADGSWKLKDRLTDDELRQFLEVAKIAAEKAEIPFEAEAFDPSDELKRIVDEALK